MWFTIASAVACETWGPPTQLAEVLHVDLTEASGVAASRKSANVGWTQDDSGKAVVYRFDLGGVIEKFAIDGADNIDWEDISSGPCRGSGDCLYIADTGANRLDPGNMEIYVVREPRPRREDEAPDDAGHAVLVERWNLMWPDGLVLDAEALLVHPCTRDAWIVTKGEVGEVYRIPDNRGITRRAVEHVGTLGFRAEITAGDFAPDGTALVIRSDKKIWRLPFDSANPDAHWGDEPDLVARLVERPEPWLPEFKGDEEPNVEEDDRKGEGMAWEQDGDLLLVDEGQPTPVGRLVCLDEVVQPVCEPEGGCGCATGAPGPWWLGFGLLPALWRRSAAARPASAGSAGPGRRR